MTPQMKNWVDVLGQVGIPGLIVVAIILFGWSLRPHIVKWFRESTKQSRVTSDAIPDMQISLRKMAMSAMDNNDLAIEMNKKLDILISRGS